MIYTNDLKIPTNLTLRKLGYPTERIEMTSVNTNTSASKASLAMFNANKAQVKSSERLSSGKRINGGADDAAGICRRGGQDVLDLGRGSAGEASRRPGQRTDNDALRPDDGNDLSARR